MKRLWVVGVAGLCLLFAAGCRSFCEPWHVLVGTSLRGVEKARRTGQAEAVTLPLPVDACFARILALSEEHGLKVLRCVPEQRIAILIGIPGSIDTTEVGVFVDPCGDGPSRIEIASVSSHACRWVRTMIETGP